jgi:hypothetical protein
VLAEVADPLAGGAATAYQYGLAGVVIVALGVFAWRVYGDLRADRAALRAEVAAERDRSAALEKDVRERLVPLLTEVARLNTVATDVLRERRQP